MAGGCKLQPKIHRQETEAGPDETAEEAEPNPVYCYFASEVPVPGIFFWGPRDGDGVFFFFGDGWEATKIHARLLDGCDLMGRDGILVEARDFWGGEIGQWKWGGSYA